MWAWTRQAWCDTNIEQRLRGRMTLVPVTCASMDSEAGVRNHHLMALLLQTQNLCRILEHVTGSMGGSARRSTRIRVVAGNVFVPTTTKCR